MSLFLKKFKISFLVCKIVAIELSSKLKETGKTHEVIETGYSLDETKKKKTKYRTS